MKNMLMSVTLASAVALLSQCAAAENVTYHLEDLDLSTMTKGSNAVARASFQCNTGRFCLEWLAC